MSNVPSPPDWSGEVIPDEPPEGTLTVDEVLAQTGDDDVIDVPAEPWTPRTATSSASFAEQQAMILAAIEQRLERAIETRAKANETIKEMRAQKAVMESAIARYERLTAPDTGETPLVEQEIRDDDGPTPLDPNAEGDE